MATIAQLQAYLVQAEDAYNALAIGQSVRVTVDQNGERVEFTAANADRLQKYIYSLKVQLGQLRPLGPAGVIL